MILRNIFLAIILYISLYIGCYYAFIETISAGLAGAGVGSVVSYVAYKVNSWRSYGCSTHEIPANFQALEELLKEKIFGQPLIQKSIIRALRAHWNTKHKPDKALTLSFHGGPGVGKNYVSTLIQEALYSPNGQISHVHTFTARLNFPEANKVEIYKKDLASWIIGNVTNCPRQLFVFDEVNHMPPGVLDVIKPFIDYFDFINGVSYRECIFIFLSNIGSNLINDRMYELWKKGVDRNSIKLSHFEKTISHGAFNENGGFHHSEAIRSDLIDHYIPFLPLMKQHVKACIVEEFKNQGDSFPSENKIQEILEYVDWAPEEDRVFSKTGCKRIKQKVGMLLY